MYMWLNDNIQVCVCVHKMLEKCTIRVFTQHQQGETSDFVPTCRDFAHTFSSASMWKMIYAH